MAERYKLGDIDNERFYQIPKSFFINPKYKGVSNTAKIIYAILKDRMELSRKNGWHDANDDIYLLFDQQEIADLLATSRVTINRNMKELKDAGLIDLARQGLGKPNKIYINKPGPYCSEHQNVTKMHHQDVTKMLHLNVSNFNSNDTESSDTELNDTESKGVSGDTPTTRTRKRKQFIPPTLDDVRAYVAEKKLGVDAKRFFDYYEAGNWHDGKGNAVKNWKQKCITWDKHTDSKPVTTTCKTRTSNVVADPMEYKRQQEALEAQARAELFGTMGCSQ